MRPLIGITTRNFTNNEGITPIVGCRQAYVDSILAAGGLPCLLPVSDDLLHAKELLELCSGILLTGGEDVEPALYNATPHEKLETVDIRRDSFELCAIRAAQERNLPILGICRGAQILNVALGGTLYQDIESEVDDALAHPSGGYLASRVSAETHPVSIEEHTLLHAIFGKDSMMTNSLHHQSVKELGRGLRVSARTSDGIIEAIERETLPFCLAVQFHPETMWQETNPEFLKIFEAFVEAARRAQH